MRNNKFVSYEYHYQAAKRFKIGYLICGILFAFFTTATLITHYFDLLMATLIFALFTILCFIGFSNSLIMATIKRLK